MRDHLLVLFLASLACALGCQGVIVVDPLGGRGRDVAVAKKGPPAHAPAHGYRHKRVHEPELRFDAGLGVHVVVGHAGLYFSDGTYLRFSGGDWSASVAVSGPWKPIGVKKLPRGLRSAHHAKKKGKHGVPAKGHW